MANNIGSLGVVLALDSAKFDLGLDKSIAKVKGFAIKTSRNMKLAQTTLSGL